MRFEAIFPATQVSNNALVYIEDEYSFNVLPVVENFTSVVINDLNLELNKKGRVISVWGYCPYMTWRAAGLNAPEALFGDVFFVPDSPLKPGVSIRPSGERWPIFVDASSGWVHVDGGCEAELAVQILAGVVLEIDMRGSLCGLWLRPERLPQLG